MRLSFRKSVLLFTTVVLGSMLGASAQNPQTTNENVLVEGYTFEREWKSTAVPTSQDVLFTDYRQGFGQNNQFYIQNKNSSAKKIEIYDQNGYVDDFAASGLGSNITKDEAGNVLVRLGRYPTNFARDRKLALIKADGSQSIELSLPTGTGCPTTRGDYFGFAQGDFFSAEGGKMAYSTAGLDYFYVLEIKNGTDVGGFSVTLPYKFGDDADVTFTSDALVQIWKDANGNSHYLAINNYENPIDIVLDANNNPTATTINIRSYSNYGSCTGANCFAFNGKNYIMFSTLLNWNDGFVIAELGTNADGTLDGTVNVVAQHVNDYTEAMGDNVSSKCDWLNWEPRDSKSIYIYQYFPGYYMARYIFGIETDETPLVDIVNDGTVGETYTVADNILGVYIAQKDPTRVYAKDYGKHRYPSTIKDGETDFVKDDVHLQSDQGWDQSNWVLLDFGTSEKAQKYLGKVIKGGTLTGVLTNKLNPTMTVTESTVPTEAGSYDENHYIGCNFMDPNVQSNIFWHGSTYNFFFVEPKPQEYVKVHWARYNGGSAAGAHFDIVTDSQLKGSFNVDWSLYPRNWEQDFIIDNAYSFHAIVRYVEGTKAGAVEGDYMVFPLEGGDIVTAIENVSTRGEVASVTYVNMLGIESPTPFSGINIVVTKYENGTRITKSMK